ncbi:hypothetical protein HKX41_13300, partial [Salinisphaera sp. USBA-960]|nr:hypothetical protein [Salifodinibacter halophilus]
EGEVLVRVETLSAFAGHALLTGFGVSGSTNDGPQRILLRPGGNNASILTSQDDAPAGWAKPKVLKYTLAASGAKKLENP